MPLVALTNFAFCHTVYLCVVLDSHTKYSIKSSVFLIEMGSVLCEVGTEDLFTHRIQMNIGVQRINE
jgi:hypothetical protein